MVIVMNVIQDIDCMDIKRQMKEMEEELITAEDTVNVLQHVLLVVTKQQVHLVMKIHVNTVQLESINHQQVNQVVTLVHKEHTVMKKVWQNVKNVLSIHTVQVLD